MLVKTYTHTTFQRKAQSVALSMLISFEYNIFFKYIALKPLPPEFICFMEDTNIGCPVKKHSMFFFSFFNYMEEIKGNNFI